MAGGQFDIQYSGATPAVVSMPRANTNVDTGADMLGQAFAHLGESAFGVAMGMKKTQQALDLSNMKRKYDETNYAAMTALETAYDEDSQKKIIEQRDKDLSSIQSNDAEVNNQFTLHVNDTLPQFNRAVGTRIVANKQKELTANFEANGNALLGDGDLDGYTNLVNSMEFIPKAQRDSLIKNAPVESKFSQAIKMGDVDLNKAEAMVSGLKDLTPDQQIKKESMLTHFNALRNRKNSALAVQQDKEKYDLWKKSEDGTLTDGDIESSVLSAEDRIYLKNNFQTVQYQKAKAEISARDEGDPTQNMLAYESIDRNPEKIKESDIYTWVNKRVGAKYIVPLVDRRRANLANKNPIDQKYKSKLADLNTGSEIFGKKGSIEQAENYLKQLGKLETFLKTNPTDEHAQKYFSELIREKVKGGFISSIFNPEITKKQALVQTLVFGGGTATGSVIYNRFFGKVKEGNNPPKEYPDAVWDTERNVWTVVRDGKLMGVK
jgi:hypothetical protein